ncbi:MAG: hypothetical protein EXX96DRAFT_559562 [Benjaminiella poitrasii]|nr:MAG: hypothetical protein EXX96DRAFT_559562 [Benjaminiella poitrasii]
MSVSIEYHPFQEQRLPALRRILDSIDPHSTTSNSSSADRSDVISQPPSPPDLLHDSEEDDEDSLTTPSLFSLSPKQGFLSKPKRQQQHHHHGRRKSVPHKSPSVIQDALQASLLDKSVVFQLDMHPDYDLSYDVLPTVSCPDCGDFKCTSKVICGQSLLSALRKRVTDARSEQPMSSSSSLTPPSVVRLSRRKRARTASIIELPRSHLRRRQSTESIEENTTDRRASFPWEQRSQVPPTSMAFESDEQHQATVLVPTTKKIKRSSAVPPNNIRRPSSSSSGRPSRVKGPCQACQEASDGCMRKAFNWPFPASQIFNDKGKPFVYLCNKCGLRYNKSGGCVCRHCRWVFCKEEKRKALQHIEAMRRRRPDGQVDPNEDIENFVCSPKYWTCGRPWKVGWVLNDNMIEEEETESTVTSPHAY